jgi:hypothetical protein
MTIRTLLMAATAVTASVMLASGAQAGITIFSGQDDGAQIGGPYTNSDAAEANFLAAAAGYGATRTEGFESLSVGFSSTFSIAGASVSLSAPNYGNGFSGISNTTFGNLYGFNTTAGGSNWLGFPGGSATFTFTKPTNSFGFFTTGVQTIFTSDLSVNFNDGQSEQLSLPINVNGGVSYFGFTDSSSIKSITISDISNDAWGIDDVSFNFSAVPEPATWALMLLGIGGLGATMRSRRKQALAVG